MERLLVGRAEKYTLCFIINSRETFSVLFQPAQYKDSLPTPSSSCWSLVVGGLFAVVEGVSLQELNLGVGAQVSEREGECWMGRHPNEQEPARMPPTRAPYTLLL